MGFADIGENKMATKQTTLAMAKVAAYMVGWHDANKGRVYRDSFDPGSQLRDMGLHNEYDDGWHDGRQNKQPMLTQFIIAAAT